MFGKKGKCLGVVGRGWDEGVVGGGGREGGGGGELTNLVHYICSHTQVM